MTSPEARLASTVLTVVDVQNGFVSPHSEFVVPRVAQLVDRWQRAGGSVVFTRYLNYEGSPFERLIHWTQLRDPPDTDLAPALMPYTERPDTYVVDKTIYTLFGDEGAKLVRDHGWTDLLVTGIATESCVLKTAVDAFELGFTPWVLRDVVASHAGDVAHKAGLLVTERFIGRDQVLDTAEALDRLGLTVPA